MEYLIPLVPPVTFTRWPGFEGAISLYMWFCQLLVGGGNKDHNKDCLNHPPVWGYARSDSISGPRRNTEEHSLFFFFYEFCPAIGLTCHIAIVGMLLP